MSDSRMFSQLLDQQRTPPPRPPSAPERTHHVSFHLKDSQIELIDRYFKLLYDQEPRPTRSAIVGAAVEVLDRILEGEPPEVLDASLLDGWARKQVGAQAPGHVGTAAPGHQGASAPEYGGTDEP